MRPIFAIGLALTCAFCANTAKADVLSPTVTRNMSGSVDGIALGDVNGDGRDEIAVTVRGGTYGSSGSTSGSGQLQILDQALNVITYYTIDDEVAGFPVKGDFDADGLAEFAFCANDADFDNNPPGWSYCYVINGDGALLFRTPRKLFFPGMTNSGPTVHDLNTDNYDDLIVVSYGGAATAISGFFGSELWANDLWLTTAHEPTFFGHPAMADIDADGSLEIVIGSWSRGGDALPFSVDGGIFTLNAHSGVLEWAIPQLSALAQNPTPGNLLSFEGSGPALADLDGDTGLEISVFAQGSAGNDHALIRLEPNGAVISWTALPAAVQAGYSSPIIVDGDGDGTAETYILGGNGSAHYIEGNGPLTLLGQVGAIANSWSTPALIDIDNNALPELVLANTQELYFYNPTDNYNVVHSFSGASVGLYPPPIISDIDSDGRLELLTGAWSPKQLYKFDLSDIGGYDWSAYMGSSKHTGSMKVGDPMESISNDPALGLFQLYHQINVAMAGKTGTQLSCLTRARDLTLIAWQEYARGNPHTALSRMSTGGNNCNGTQSPRGVMRMLNLAQTAGADVESLRQTTAWIGLTMYKHYVDRTAGTQAPDSTQITTAINTYNTAFASYFQPNYNSSIQTSASGAATLRAYLDSSSYFSNPIENDCPVPPTHVYHNGMCLIQQTLDETIALPDNSNTNNAETYIRRAIAWMPDVVLLNVFNGSASGPGLIGAESQLTAYNPTTTASIRQKMAAAGRILAREYIDDIATWRGAGNANVISAESLFASGESALAGGNYASALQNFRDAINTADNAI